MAETPIPEAPRTGPQRQASSPKRILRWAGAAAIALAGGVVVVTLTLAAAAAAVAGLVVGALVLMAYRLSGGRRARRPGVDLLEARRTPDGWVVEGARSR